MWAGIQRRYYNFQYVYGFAESEVVSLIAQNKHTDDIVHGLNKAVAAKLHLWLNVWVERKHI